MKKIILVYYGGLKNYIIFNDLLNKYPEKIECVIKTPISPKKSGKINFKAYRNLFLSDVKFVLFIFFITYSFNIFMFFSKNIKKICKKKQIKHITASEFNLNLIEELNLKKSNFVFYSGSQIIGKDVLKYFDSNIFGFHEGELPKMRGSALYFWYFLTKEYDFARCSIQRIGKILDAGKVIKYTESIKINECDTVADLWLKLIKSYPDTIKDLIIELFVKKDKINDLSNIEYNVATHLKSFPKKYDFIKLNEEGIKLIKMKNFKNFFKEIYKT